MKTRAFILVMLFTLPSLVAQHNYEHLIFEGASIKGIAYAGVIKQLEHQQIIENINKVGGTSSGAITALMLSLGYQSEEIYQIISQTKIHKFNDSGFIFFGSLHRMKKRYGWYKSDKFEKWLKPIIEAKTGDSEITFSALKERGYKELYVTGTCLNKQKLIVFSSETYPNMKIKDAVQISMSIPLYFEAKFIDEKGHVYKNYNDKPDLDVVVDGGIIGNFPIDIFDQIITDSLGNETRIPNPKTLGIRMDSDKQIEQDKNRNGLAALDINNLKTYLIAFFILTGESVNRSTLTSADWERTISVSSVGVGPRIKKLKNGEVDRLVESGEKAVIKYFENN